MSNLRRVVRPGDGRATDLPGEHIIGLFNGVDTGGRLAIAEYELDPEYGTTEHRHLGSGEFFYLLAGEAVFDLDGEEHWAPTGAAIWVAPGVAHRISNLSDSPVRMLGAFAPSGPEMLFRGMEELYARTEQPSEDDLRGVLTAYDIEPVGPSRFGRRL
jgi:quercetin dioxygenase-like cupin family protein